jgi:hypothetical protein
MAGRAYSGGCARSAISDGRALTAEGSIRRRAACGEGHWCWDQKPSGSVTKMAVIRPGAIALLMTRMLFTPLGTP